jgi:hypothetical protein
MKKLSNQDIQQVSAGLLERLESAADSAQEKFIESIVHDFYECHREQFRSWGRKVKSAVLYPVNKVRSFFNC